MTGWLALLRAVNVGGHNVIPMADLRALMADLGFADAATYLQSGNVVFAADAEADELASTIGAGIAERFGHHVEVIVRSADDLATIVANMPWQFPANSSTGVVFMTGPVATELDASAFAPDECVVAGSDVYVECPTGFGKTKLTVAWLERQTGLAGTRRNWKSVKALAARLGEM